MRLAAYLASVALLSAACSEQSKPDPSSSPEDSPALELAETTLRAYGFGFQLTLPRGWHQTTDEDQRAVADGYRLPEVMKDRLRSPRLREMA